MKREKVENYAKQIVDSGYRVYKEVGPGLLESIYSQCLLDELKFRGIRVDQEVLVPLYYRGNKLNKDFRIDLLVENEIIIEVKSVECVLPVHVAQLISYLRLSDRRLGFLMNFNVPTYREGIRRIVNKY
jgi:GxxExxY protein